MPTTSGLHATGVRVVGLKHVGSTPEGRGPEVMNSLSFAGTLPLSEVSLSWMKSTVPSPGWRGSPAPPQRDDSVAGPVGGSPTHGRVHVKPPLVERLTQTPLVSSVRLKL